jgi:elongation factor Ts
VVVKTEETRKFLVAVVLRCETDFTANSEIFRTIHGAIADALLERGVQDEGLQWGGVGQIHPQIRSSGVKEGLDELAGLTGETVVMEKSVIVELGRVGWYVHDGKMGAVVEVEEEEEVGQILARQVVAGGARTMEELLESEMLVGGEEGEGKTVQEWLERKRSKIVKLHTLGM